MFLLPIEIQLYMWYWGMAQHLLSTFNALFPALASDTKGICFEIKMCQILVVQQHKIDFGETCFLVMFHRVIACISESIRIKNNLK